MEFTRNGYYINRKYKCITHKYKPEMGFTRNDFKSCKHKCLVIGFVGAPLLGALYL